MPGCSHEVEVFALGGYFVGHAMGVAFIYHLFLLVRPWG